MHDPTDIATVTADTPKEKRLALVEKLRHRPELDFDKVAKLAHVRVGAVVDIYAISKAKARQRDFSSKALASFIEAAKQHLPLLNADDLDRARAYITGSEWRKGA